MLLLIPCRKYYKILTIDYTIGREIINRTFSKNFYFEYSRFIERCYKIYVKYIIVLQKVYFLAIRTDII